MVNNNDLINLVNNKKPVELVQELKNETPSYEEFMKNYENDGTLNYDDLKGGSIGEAKGYGPMPYASNTATFSRSYSFSHGYCLFKKGESYRSWWRFEGSIGSIEDEQWKLETGEITVVRPVCGGNYKRDLEQEERIKKKLREDVRKLRLAIREGKWISGENSANFTEDGRGLFTEEAKPNNPICVWEPQTTYNR